MFVGAGVVDSGAADGSLISSPVIGHFRDEGHASILSRNFRASGRKLLTARCFARSPRMPKLDKGRGPDRSVRDAT